MPDCAAGKKRSRFMFIRKGTSLVGYFRSLTFAIATCMAVPACFAQTAPPPSAPAPSSNSEIAWFWMGRVGFNPANGNTLPYGYFTIINGINGSPFSLFNGLKPGRPGNDCVFHLPLLHLSNPSAHRQSGPEYLHHHSRPRRHLLRSEYRSATSTTPTVSRRERGWPPTRRPVIRASSSL